MSWLDDLVSSVVDTASDAGDYIGDAVSGGIDYLGDAASSGADAIAGGLSSLTDIAGNAGESIGDFINAAADTGSLTLDGLLSSVKELASNLPTGWYISEDLQVPQFEYPTAEDINVGSFMDTSLIPTQSNELYVPSIDSFGDIDNGNIPVDTGSSLQDIFKTATSPDISTAPASTYQLLASTPDTAFNVSAGLDKNPVAAEIALKRILEDPMAAISPKDYALSSPTILDKLLAQGSIQSGDMSAPSDWFKANEWTGPGDYVSTAPDTGYQFSGRSTITDPQAYKPEESWLKKLLARPEASQVAGLAGKSLLSKILGTAGVGGQVYGALKGGNSNSDQIKKMKANISQIPTKKMTWVTPQNKAAGGSVQGCLGQCAKQGLLRSPTPGQADVIPVAAAGGEYIFDADTVSALGDGNTEAGAAKLDAMRKNIRQHKRTAPTSKIPPKARQPEQYLPRAK